MSDSTRFECESRLGETKVANGLLEECKFLMHSS